MNPDRLKAIRKAAAPDMTQAAYARALGYVDQDAYRKYESGSRPVPTLLAKLAEMIEDHGLPEGWRRA